MSLKRVIQRVLPAAIDTATSLLHSSTAQREAPGRDGVGSGRRPARRGSEDSTREDDAPRRAPYPGDYETLPEMVWDAKSDGRPDPGEVVWTWVPFQENHKRGKDRPVLLIGRDGPWLLGLPLTSRDHDLDEAQEASEGRFWFEIGTGSWDRMGRVSEVGLHRIVRVDPDNVRREGAILDRDRFDAVAYALRQQWPEVVDFRRRD